MDSPQPPHGPRRELSSRNTSWARALARTASASGITPNAISVLSIVFAAGAMACYLFAPEAGCSTGMSLSWLGAVACIQCRLLCNLLDGMVAVEGGKGTLTGPLYNEVPDRIADVLILVGAGYSTTVSPGVIKLFDTLPLGWSCAIVAMGTAYVRLLQGSLTGEQSFTGPMAKQHRMATLTIGTLAAIAELWLRDAPPEMLKTALLLILFGGLYTCGRRLLLLTRQMKAQARK